MGEGHIKHTLDMLISDFIGDLLQFHYNEKKVTLLLKEFPIKIYEENNLNAKPTTPISHVRNK